MAYTVGLLDAADHPELIIAGAASDLSGSLLSLLAGTVLDGERYEVGESIKLGRGVARVGAVDSVQYSLDTFNQWHALRHHGAVEAPTLEARQIVLPRALFCDQHGDLQPRLDDPEARVGSALPRPNRAERRRRSRHRR